MLMGQKTLAWAPTSKSFSLRSEVMKIISNFLPAALTFLYTSASFGVKARHGGHLSQQEKLSPSTGQEGCMELETG